MIEIRRDNFLIYIGRDFLGTEQLSFFVGIGRKIDPTPGEISWRYHWRCAPDWPLFIRDNKRIVGICAFGRCWIWW